MCGIVGEFVPEGEAAPGSCAAMLSQLAHRGPDDSGLWQSPDGRCVLGHRRLSIIDLSPLGHQPMVDPLTGNTITFNGEIYNFQALRRECEADGSVFRSHSDTEVILALYRQHGAGCLQFLRGMFAFAIWDQQRRRLFLARDRVGKKPLNYALTASSLVFCSELHPLARRPGIDAAVDPEALELYLQCLFIPAPWTIYRGIRKLPPAHYAIYDHSGLKIEPYWQIDYRHKIRISEADALEALEEKLTEAVRLRMISDVPLGAMLSGGVDSSLVVALMAKASGAPVRTFSIGFAEDGFNELPFARQVAERCRTVHHPEILQGNVEDLLPKLVRHYGEPFADPSAVPSFFVSAAARRHVIVALNGDGGDELLGGYQRYGLPDSVLRSARVLGGSLSPQFLAQTTSRFAAPRTFSERLVRRVLLHYSNPELRSLTMYNAYWNDAERRQLLPDGPEALVPDFRRAWLEDAFHHATNPVDRMLWLDNRIYLAGDLLVKMDIASMHCGLEARSPLLDQQVIEFCASLPVEMKVRQGTGKYLLKKLAERYFPRALIYRQKMGFGIPLAEWLRTTLKPLVHLTLDDPGLMEPMEFSAVQGSKRAFFEGKTQDEYRIWTLLVFGLWKQSIRDFEGSRRWEQDSFLQLKPLIPPAFNPFGG